MNRICTFTMTALALLGLGLAVPGGDAVAQQASLKQRLVGTWTFVSTTGRLRDGSPAFGPNPRGVLVIDASGRYYQAIMRSDRAKFVSNNRFQGTADENKATVQGTIAHFGRYSVIEADKTFTYHIESSAYPNSTGTDEKRQIVTLTADELKWTGPASTAGGLMIELVWKRAP